MHCNGGEPGMGNGRYDADIYEAELDIASG